ncbi:MAG: YegS/Rv2252/BmrU family lipid kinase [Peptoniphilaceae bacterium]|nr:YegS/Rv2252/BmrU family lipid kinase [Peptoniphilaceae bacterium]MDD7382758.1 YegS/Rv2252/BmrU family lipid kinase [Peptoniphilaceae bacterium]MDY3737914.1 YegS/Rv2252/BmrU family lipid kinase [Peptoniphilaceae bacterium]
MKKILFLYNPKSGKGSIKEKISDILEYYSSKNILTTVYATQDVGDGREKIQEIGKDYDFIVVSGGDGTLDEIISGALKSDLNPTIGYIPTGSTNDFATTLEIPSDNLQRAVFLSIEGNTESIDIGKLDDKYFVYVAAFGSFADISYETDQGMKNIFGHAAYILEGLKTLTNLVTYNLDIDIDGEIIKDEFILGMITNTVSVGGFKGIISKEVELSDGKFEITLIKKPKNIMDFNKIITSLGSDNKDDELIITRKGTNIKISSDKKIKWTLDGEYGGSEKNSEIQIVNKAIKINTGINIKNN